MDPFDELEESYRPPEPEPTTRSLDAVVSVPLALDTIIEHGYDGPITLGVKVAEILAQRLEQEAGRADWTKMLASKIEAEADRIVAEKLQGILDREIVPTNPYGAAQGQPTTIVELMMKQAETWMTNPAKNSSSSYGHRPTNLEKLLSDALDHRFQSELNKIIDDARKRIVKEVADKAGVAYSSALEKSLKGSTVL